MGYTLFPNLLAMILSINILLNSGIVNKIINILFSSIKIPVEIIFLIVTKPISGSGSIGVLNTIFSKYGVDSFNGLLASTVQGCTDTTFYVLALYYGCIGIKKIRYAPLNSLIGDIVGIVVCIIMCYKLFY